MYKKTNEGIRCTELRSSKFSAYNTDMNFESHTHSYYEIVITLESNFTHIINERPVIPKAGDVVIFRPGDSHSAFPNGPSGHRVRDIYVPEAMLIDACISLDADLLNRITDSPEPPAFHLSEKYIGDLERRVDFPFFGDTLLPKPEDEKLVSIIKKSIVTELLGQYIYSCFNEERALPDCLVNLIRHFLNPAYQNTSIEDIAVAMGYSHTYICRVFREYFGKTIQQYLLEERIDKSIPLLQTRLTVGQIAVQMGWKKPDNYIDAFKKIYNTTPGQYRIALREMENSSKTTR